MTMRHEIFDKDVCGEMVSPNDPGYDLLIADIFDTMKTSTEMNTGYRTPEEVHGFMGRIGDKPLDESTTVLPPLYIDYGKPIKIEDKVWLGINATVLPGVTLGYGCIVGANSVVTKDVPPMTIVAGNPARIIKKIEV